MHVEQAVAALRFAPAIPAWLLAVLAALCVAALVPALLRRARGAVWRAACFAVLLLWLAGPRLVRETRDALSDIALLMVDETASMQVGTRAALRDAARANLEAQAAKLPGLELRTVVVPDAGPRAGDSGGTRLFTAMDRALADIPRSRLAGVLALTDGQVHDAPATPPPAPFHMLLPARGEETDRRLRVIEAPSYGIVGRSVTLRVAVEDLGVPKPGGAARLTVRRDGEPPQIVQVPVGAPQPIEIPINRAGPILVELTAETLPGEVSDLNNHAVIEINGVRDRLRVLLVSGEPHAGERTWRRLLKADPAVDLVHFTILRPPDKDDMTPLNELALIAFPIRELFQVKIRDFDLIILDRFQNRNILPATYLRNIADYVRGGGALLMSVGPEFAGPASLAYTPLGGVMLAHPTGLGGVVEQPFRPLVTALGQRHPVTAALPGDHPGAAPSWAPWYRRLDALDTHGQALMSGADGQPLLLLDHVGDGRAAMLLSDQIWLWSREDAGGPQAELLRRVAHWLMKEPSLEEEALTARIDGGTLHVERRTASDVPAPEITLTAPGGATSRVALQAVSPGRATGDAPAAAPGVWQASDGTHSAFAAAGTGNPQEFADLRASAEPIGPIARASGGGTHWLAPAGAPELRQVEAGRAMTGSGWAGLRRNHDHVVTGLDSQPLLPPWLALPLLLGLAVLAWRREGTG